MSTASAQFSTFPPIQKPGAEKSAGSMHRVSPNLDKESGIMMYAATNGDATMYNSWVSLRANRPSFLTRHFAWLDYTGDDDVYRVNVQPAAGAYNPDDGKYYVMLTFVYDCYWNFKGTFNYIPQHWYSIDLANGATQPVEVANLKTWSKEKGWESYSMDPNAPHWGLWSDMSFDPVDETMYALAQTEETLSDDNPYHSTIVQVQLKDGSYRVKKELRGHYYLGFTYDLDGKVYAARWTTDPRDQINGSVIVELDRETFEEKREVAKLEKDGMPFKLCYNGTLDVDRATGELYFAGADFDSGRQYLFKINPKTGTSTYISAFSYDNIVGLHIPYVGTENRNAPARVTNMHTEAAENGANSVTIKWTNPTTQWNLEDLTSITGVKIYRDDMNGEPVANITDNVTVGGESSYVDNTTQGLHTYYVIPYNENGDGVSDSIAAFVGKDTPDAPKNLNVQIQSSTNVYLSWSEPTTGLHDGWFDNSNIKYTITRSDGVVVAENITDKQYNDTKFDDAPMSLYTYTVTSSNADGEGGSAVSEPVLAGSDYPIPYTFDFSNATDRDAFSIYNPTSYTNWSNTAYMNAWSIYTYDNDPKLDAYLCTPLFNVKAGHTYRVTWNLKFDMAGSTVHTYELTAGPSSSEQTAFAQDSYDESLTGAYAQETVSTGEYTAEADGKYMFGFHLTTDGLRYEQISIVGVKVEEVFSNDVAANSLNGFPRILKGKAQGYTVNVHNSGRTEQNNIKVQTGYKNRRGEFIVLGETTHTEALPGGEKRNITVPTTADFENGTSIDLCARIMVEGDESVDNDICPSIPVMVEDIEGADAFNAEFIGDKLSTGDYGDTNVPFTTYSPNTTSVTIYPLSLLATTGKEPYKISRIGFTSYNSIDISECDVKVYMGTTDDKMFNLDANWSVDNVISPSDLQLVYSGVSTAMKEGADGISIQFDEPFLYNGTNNLVVALEVTCHSGTGNYGIHWNTWDREVGKYQSIKTNSTTWDSGKVSRGDGMPDLHMAVVAMGLSDSVENISAEAAFGMTLNGRTIYLSGNVKSLNVYDLAGRHIDSKDVTGRNSVSLNVPDGIYLIKAADANGNARTLKAAIR